MLTAICSVLTIILIACVIFVVPPAEGMGYLVRILFFHVPTAWIAVLAFFQSAWWGYSYLKKKDLAKDALSGAAAKLGFIFVLLSCVSGAIFSKLTWGAYWNWDPRQTTIFVLILIYGAYLTLRASISDERKRASLAGVYSLFSCVTVPFLVFIIPRMYFSLHPSPIINSGGHVDMDTIMLVVLIGCIVDATLIYWRALQLLTKEKKPDELS